MNRTSLLCIVPHREITVFTLLLVIIILPMASTG